MVDSMTPKERWLAAIHLEPVDRLPFWPKLDAAYPRAQKAPFCDMDNSAIHDWIGSDKHVGIPGCVKEARKKTSAETSRQNGIMKTVYQTPRGETEMIRAFDEASQSWHPIAFPVQTLKDVGLMTAIYDDVTVELDQESQQKAKKQSARIGQDALTTSGIGKSPLMHWVEWLAGVETAHYLLADHQEEVETLFQAMHRVLRDRTALMAAHSPADVLYLVENTSTTLISPEQYRRYCYPHVSEYAELTREAGRNLILHMCGHLQALLPDLGTLRAEAFEAFTSPTLGNTTLLDGRTHCPDKCLIGGTNAVLWTRPADEIIARIEQDLEALSHHRGIVVTSAGVMPPLCPPPIIKEVCAWVRTYPARMAA